MRNPRSAAGLCVSGAIVALAYPKASGTFQYFRSGPASTRRTAVPSMLICEPHADVSGFL